MKPGDIVKHKKDKYLTHGRLVEIAPSKVRARVYWRKEDNPRLAWGISAYYRLDLLEQIPDEEA